ncbi:UV-stimulated scaffold protein A [Trichoplax sp. H2]|nr:UV-stimulated scaffold protein A [Trichoplax sp. H2]|eukprot:RDD42712.1 UV-stimulated scaffold protein A [Trichoplax sp. H2]
MDDQLVDITICQQLSQLITQVTESGQAKLDEKASKEIKKLCRQLITQVTESGQAKLDEKASKEIKKLCRISDGYIKQAYHRLMTQLAKDHAEIRLSAVQVIDELFMRSHTFREALLNDFNQFLDLTVETNLKIPLPPPQTVARNLKRLTLEAMRRWHQQFGKGYRKLQLGYVFLKEKKHIDFEDIYARSLIERQEEERKKKKAEELATRKRECVCKSMEEFVPDIQRILTEMTTCFELLIPSYRRHTDDDLSKVTEKTDQPSIANKNDHLTNNNQNNEEISDAKGEEKPLLDSALHHTSNQTLSKADENLREHGMLSHSHNVVVVIDQDNIMQIRENADNCDILDLLNDSQKLLKHKYLLMVNKWLDMMTKAQGDQDSLYKIIDIRDEITQTLDKFSKLTIIPMSPISKKLLKNNVAVEEDEDSSDEFIEVEEQVNSDNDEDIFGESLDLDNDNADLENFKMRASNENENTFEQQKLRKRRELLAVAPVIPFGIDLYHWEDKDSEIPRIENKNTSQHQFWFNSNEDDVDIPECPFHGIIIPRNAKGQPVNPDGSVKKDSLTEASATRESQAGPSWKDIQEEIEAGTGITFTKPGKKRKGTKRKSKSNLTNLKEAKNTSRYRLEDKIFKPSVVKKMKKAQIDEMQRKAHDKFMHNWNYSLRK